jgi:hypothetical protein
MGDHDEDKDEYKVPTKVGLNDLLERDKDDAALESYKKQLLGTNFYKRTCVSVCLFGALIVACWCCELRQEACKYVSIVELSLVRRAISQ